MDEGPENGAMGVSAPAQSLFFHSWSWVVAQVLRSALLRSLLAIALQFLVSRMRLIEIDD